MKLNLDERETHFNIVADKRAECEVYTDDPVWRPRLLKWFQPYKTSEEGAWFRVPTKQGIRAPALVHGNETLKRTAASVPVP